VGLQVRARSPTGAGQEDQEEDSEEEGQAMRAVRRDPDAPVEDLADRPAGHALQRLWDPGQDTRGGAAGAGVPPPSGDSNDDGRLRAPATGAALTGDPAGLGLTRGGAPGEGVRAPPSSGDGNDDGRLRARAAALRGDPGLGVPAGQPDPGIHDRCRRVPAEEDVAQAGEVSTASSSSGGTRAGPGQRERQAGEVVPALRHHVDPAVEDGAGGRKHAVQRVRRALQAGPPGAGIPAEGEPYVQPVGARLQAPRGAQDPQEAGPSCTAGSVQAFQDQEAPQGQGAAAACTNSQEAQAQQRSEPACTSTTSCGAGAAARW